MAASATQMVAEPVAPSRPKGRILLIFADGKHRRELMDIARAMASRVQAAFSVKAGRDICLESQFDVLLRVGEPHHVAQAKMITDLGGWAAEMPIVAVCSGSLDLAEARAAGLSVLIPDAAPVNALIGALKGSMAADGRSPTWWID